MNDRKPLPSFQDASLSLAMFVSDIAKDYPDIELREKAKHLMADYILSGIIEMAKVGADKS